jgi:hypothetical protein
MSNEGHDAHGSGDGDKEGRPDGERDFGAST